MILGILFIISFLIGLRAESQPITTPGPITTIQDPEKSKRLFLELLSQFEGIEQKGNTTVAEKIFDKSKSQKEFWSIIHHGGILEGEIVPTENKEIVQVRYPKYGLVSFHHVVEDGETFYLKWAYVGNSTFTEIAKGPKTGDRVEGLFLIYEGQELWYIGKNIQIPMDNYSDWLKMDRAQKELKLSQHKNQGGLIVHDGPSLEWDHQTNHDEIRDGKALDEMGNEPWVYYWPNTNLKCTGQTKDGKRTGKWVYYYPTGEKNSEFDYDNKGVIIHYQGWYENGSLFCEESTKANDGSDKRNHKIFERATEELYQGQNGIPLYATYASTENQEDPLAIIYWPNGNPAVKKYSQLDTCGSFNFELLDPSGKVFFIAQSFGDPGAHGLGCGQKIEVANTRLSSNFPDGPMILGEWNLANIINYTQPFCPVITANFKNGLLDGELVIKWPNDSVDNIFASNFCAIFSLKKGVLDGKSIVAGIGTITYEYKNGKLINKEELESKEYEPNFDYLRKILNGEIKLNRSYEE